MTTIHYRPRVTGGDREKLRDQLSEKYRQGASIRELADQSRRSYGFVRHMLTEAGVALRGRGGSHRMERD